MQRFPVAPASAAPDAIPALCRRFHVRRLDLFGSTAAQHFDPVHSDFDFLVEFEDMPGAAYAKAYFGLKEALAKLLGREVDLLTQAALENLYLRQQVESERRRLFPP